ncbi:hypothetical protein L7F22_009507 [Adiantum nelumboides]|nr:hypothetical protein [Adiantum nelumboides]
MFPRCISILNSFTDDDPSELSYIKLGSSEEHKRKKRRYSELKCMIAEAFQKDVAAMERHTPDRYSVSDPRGFVEYGTHCHLSKCTLLPLLLFFLLDRCPALHLCA